MVGEGDRARFQEERSTHAAVPTANYFRSAWPAWENPDPSNFSSIFCNFRTRPRRKIHNLDRQGNTAKMMRVVGSRACRSRQFSLPGAGPGGRSGRVEGGGARSHSRPQPGQDDPPRPARGQGFAFGGSGLPEQRGGERLTSGLLWCCGGA
jgi:hypothetical protein